VSGYFAVGDWLPPNQGALIWSAQETNREIREIRAKNKIL
jgi:hypothetical protein